MEKQLSQSDLMDTTTPPLPFVPTRRKSTSWPSLTADTIADNKSSFKFPRKSALKVRTVYASLHSTWESSSHDPKFVEWSNVFIRRYERIVGDNPSCSSGPPLSIGWEYDPRVIIHPIDEYETIRPPRKSQHELVLGRDQRSEILISDWKLSHSTVSHAVRINVKAKNERRRTLINSGNDTILRLEACAQSLRRKIQRVVLLKPRPSREAFELEQKHLAAQAQREEIWQKLNHRQKQGPPNLVEATVQTASTTTIGTTSQQDTSDDN